MIQASSALDAYVDANILLLMACALWYLARTVMRATGAQQDYSAQLKLLNITFFGVLLSPFVITGVGALSNAGMMPAGYPPALSDFIVAQYLNGSVPIAPSEMERILSLRETVSRDILSLQGGAAMALVTGMTMGFAVLAGRLIFSFVQLRRVIGASYPWRRAGRLHLRLSPSVSVPFSTRGLWRRYAIFPAAMLSDPKNLKIALGHELQHVRQHDVEWEIGLELLRPLLFWNPAFYLWKRQVEQLRELACDQVLIGRRRYDLRAYCECLFQACANSLRQRGSGAAHIPRVGLVRTEGLALGSRSALLLQARVVSMIEGGPSRRHPAGFLALAAMVTVSLWFGSIAIQRPGDWSHDRIMLSTIVNLERMGRSNDACQTVFC